MGPVFPSSAGGMAAGRWVPLATVPKRVGVGKALAVGSGVLCWWGDGEVDMPSPLRRAFVLRVLREGRRLA